MIKINREQAANWLMLSEKKWWLEIFIYLFFRLKYHLK
jgi:hypothetical protein